MRKLTAGNCSRSRSHTLGSLGAWGGTDNELGRVAVDGRRAQSRLGGDRLDHHSGEASVGNCEENCGCDDQGALYR